MNVCSTNTCLVFYCMGNCRTERNLDGGARIFIEMNKKWLHEGYSVNFLTTIENYDVCQRYGVSGVNYTFIPSHIEIGNLYLCYIVRTLSACIWSLTVKIPKSKGIVIYSGSDFWPDSIPAWLLKKRFPYVKWIAAFYLFAPSPFSRGSPYKGLRRLKGLFFYLSQMPAYFLIRKKADMVWVTSEPDRWMFGKRLSPDKVVVVQGGVDIKTPALVPDPVIKSFDAVFIGRFHPQKGVLELVDIWRLVIQSKHNAKLAIIGVGPLERELKEKITAYGLKDNVVFFGFKDGLEKIKIFKASKIVVHPAIYDSGGMAACEAMACGLPGVSFDLPALRTYYPKGMLKTPCFDLRLFAKNVCLLLDDAELYQKFKADALALAKEWDWDKKSEELTRLINECV